MIKANAYGHGLLKTAQSLKSVCACFGVARLCEAESVRSVVNSDILVCSEFIEDKESILKAIKHNIMLTASSVDDLKIYNQIVKEYNKPLKLHIKTDSGMNRLGIKSENELYQMLLIFKSNENLVLKGIFTHFADCKDLVFTDKQFEKFLKFVIIAKKEYPHIKAHCASSVAIFTDKKYHLDMVRPGINLYGFNGENAFEKGFVLKPAMEVFSTVMAVKKAYSGESIGYCQNFKVKADTGYAVICAGYGDGYKRILSNKGYVLINGKLYKTAGNICMDSFMVNTGLHADVKSGDKVVLISNSCGYKNLSFEKISKRCNTIVYEIITSFTDRAVREYIN